MLKKILMILVVVVVVLVVIASTRPSQFSVARTVVMAAPPSAVFAQVNDLHKWEAWSPWAKMDPQMKTTYEGPAAGKGAKMSWAGNSKVGEGTMTILDSEPSRHILFGLEFRKPFAANHAAEFTFFPRGKETVVGWNMYGKVNFWGKVMGLFMDCDKMIGSQFETGLAQLKSIVEKPTKK